MQDRKHQHVQQNQTPRNLVVAVDASTTGEKLCTWTLHNIARAGDRVHALHVLPTMSRPHNLQAYAEALLGPQTTGPSDADLQQLQHRKHTKLGQRLHALMPTDGAPQHATLPSVHMCTRPHTLHRLPSSGCFSL